MLLPMLAAGELVGVVEFERRSLTPYTDDERARVQGLAGWWRSASPISACTAMSCSKRSPTASPGSYNKRQILKTLADETSRAKRYGKPSQ